MNQFSSKTLRVLQIIPKLNMGGAERGTLEMAFFLKEKKIFSAVVSGGGNLVSLLEKNGVPHVCMSVESKNPVTIFMNIFRLRRIIKTHRINVVDVRSRVPAWSAFFAVRKTSVKLVTSFHGLYKHQNFLKKLYNSVMTKGHKIVAVSDFIQDHIRKVYGIGPNRIKMIHRGVDLNVFDPEKVSKLRLATLIQTFGIPEDKFVILVPGRISRPKGHLLVVEALSYLKDYNFMCLFVGQIKNDAYLKEIEQQANLYGVRDSLVIQNSCSDMAALYKIAAVTLNPSVWPESFGRTIVEAGAMGCPVVATSHGGVREIILDGNTGFLCDIGDAKSLADSIKRIFCFTKKERTQMADNAIQHVRGHFSNLQMFEKTLKVYHEVLG